jgi:predicted RNA binding protein YcfA (HicA-like mRNA interferase family)
MEIIPVNSTRLKSLLILAACGWGLWRMASRWLGPAATPGEVAILTSENFSEVRRTAKTLVALYMQPGWRSCSSTADMFEPMAKHVSGRAIIAVCDLSKNPDLARRENAESGTMIIYRDGHEVARSNGVANAAFNQEMQALGLAGGGWPREVPLCVHYERTKASHRLAPGTVFCSIRDIMKFRELYRKLADDGWYEVHCKGSHRQFKHATKPGKVTVNGHPGKDVTPFLLNSIEKQAGWRNK